MIEVLYDISPMLESNWTGIPVFAARLCRMLLEDSGIHARFCVGSRIIERDAVLNAISANTGLYLRAGYESGVLVIREVAKPATKFLSPTVKQVFGLAESEASVIHDLSTIITPEFHTADNVSFHRNSLMREISTNDVLFAVSEATRQDLIYYCGASESRVVVVPQFVDWPTEFISLFESEYGGIRADPYALVIGTIEPRKNLRIIFDAAQTLFEDDTDFRIVILGKKGWRLDEVLDDAAMKLVEAGRIVFTGFVDEYTKYCLLRLARFTVFPSVFEGFGIPVLESLDVGTPVLASWSSSIPEVGLDAAEYFDPLSSEDFFSKFRTLRALDEVGILRLRIKASVVAENFSPESFYRPIATWLRS